MGASCVFVNLDELILALRDGLAAMLTYFETEDSEAVWEAVKRGYSVMNRKHPSETRAIVARTNAERASGGQNASS
jgi:hypothetical protein